jgi:hypothetical protein
VGEILVASARSLLALEKENPCRLLAERLYKVRATFIEHADPFDLSGLVAQSVALCKAISLYRLGGTTIEDVMDRQAAVTKAGLAVMEPVMGAIDRGELLIKDGKIVNPGSR